MMARKLSVLVALGLVLSWGATADTVMHGRVSYESGGAMVKGSGDSDWSYATVNTLVLPNDTLWADTGALLELELSGGTFLRMADQSKVDVVTMPPNALFRGWGGSYYVHRTSRSTGAAIFQTPAAFVDVSRDTHVRIDVVDSGATTITVRWGSVAVRTETGAPVGATAGQRIYVDPGYLPSMPQRFDTTAEDDFDAWSRERARLVALGGEAIPSSYRVSSEPIGAYELANYGDWVTVDNTPYWRPTVAVDYTPYRHGIWTYTNPYGYVWVDDYPFSYITTHYGRWIHNPSYGWLWGYNDVWGPAWVASVRMGPYFAWAPLDPFGYPCVVGRSVWDYGSFTLSLGAGSYCLASGLYSGYSYGRPISHGAFNQINTGDIYVWNIFGNEVNINYPWTNGLPVRDFKPDRVMRGPDSIASGSRVARAADRATRLEAASGRADFAAVDRTGARSVRTTTTSRSRDARVRAVGVDTARELEGVRTSERVARAAESSTDRTVREAAARDRTRSDREGRGDTGTEVARTDRTRGDTGAEAADRRVRGESARSGDDSSDDSRVTRVGRDRDEVSAPASTQPPSEDRGSKPDRTTREARTEPSRTEAPEARAERTVRETPSEDRASRGESLRSEARESRTTPDRTERMDRTPSPESRATLDRTPDRTPAAAETRTERSAPAERTSPSGDRGRTSRDVSSIRTENRAAPRAIQFDASRAPGSLAAPSRDTSSRTPAAAQAPGRTETPRSMDNGGRSAERTAPRTIERTAPSAPQRSAPIAAPRTIERSAPTAPSRSAAPRNVNAAPRTITLPRESAQRSASMAPPRAQAPSRQVQMPRSVAQTAPRQVEMPRAQMQSPPRQVEMPRSVVQSPPRQVQMPSRQVQMPQQRVMERPAPRMEMPSAPAMPQRQIEMPRMERREAPSMPQISGPNLGGGRGGGGGGASERAQGRRAR